MAEKFHLTLIQTADIFKCLGFPEAMVAQIYKLWALQTWKAGVRWGERNLWCLKDDNSFIDHWPEGQEGGVLFWEHLTYFYCWQWDDLGQNVVLCQQIKCSLCWTVWLSPILAMHFSEIFLIIHEDHNPGCLHPHPKAFLVKSQSSEVYALHGWASWLTHWFACPSFSVGLYDG